MKPFSWEQRIQRANELADIHPFATEALRFYASVATLQKEFYSYLTRRFGTSSESDMFQMPPEFSALLPNFAEFLSGIQAISKRPLAESARNLSLQPDEQKQVLLSSSWRSLRDSQLDAEDPEDFLAGVFLQAYAEYAAARTGFTSPTAGVSAVCPVCSGKPLVGVLRPEGDGAKRSLICSVCATEWNYGRLICTACGEETVEKLAVYSTAQFSDVRIEACDTCRHYIKTVDLTKNGLAVPMVDELATIPLNLWAEEHGYKKSQTNFLGL
jgi:FdhE protein